MCGDNGIVRELTQFKVLERKRCCLQKLKKNVNQKHGANENMNASFMRQRNEMNRKKSHTLTHMQTHIHRTAYPVGTQTVNERTSIYRRTHTKYASGMYSVHVYAILAPKFVGIIDD